MILCMGVGTIYAEGGTRQFQLCVCIGNTKQLYLFLHCNTVGILTDHLLVATYPLSRLCILVSSAVVE